MKMCEQILKNVKKQIENVGIVGEIFEHIVKMLRIVGKSLENVWICWGMSVNCQNG